VSDDPFRTWDGPYVLGALSPDERATYERHLRGCPACSEAVNELAGLPGLLARADAPVDDPAAEPLPDLLPGLLFSARRERRRRRRVAALGWVAAAACAAGLVLMWLLPRSPAPVVLTSMTPATNTAVSGQIGVTGVTWGSRIELKCSYPANESGDERYDLVVWDRAGNRSTVGSWKVVPGRTATMNASTAVAAVDIEKLDVVSDAGVVLSLTR
jgi:anti-sigma factor RsiW